MANIKVHLLNFHGLVTHIEIVLENTSVGPHTYYGINRWETPNVLWDNKARSNIAQASSTYSFDIEADPEIIVQKWQKYWKDTYDQASIVGKNCAVAAQWFLTEFAGIPEPNASNISTNHLAFGIFWPSFISCPITLGGRVMDNAKFHIECKKHPEAFARYSKLFLYSSLAVAALVCATSIVGITLAATILTGGIAAAVFVGCALVGIASTHVFFKAYSALSVSNNNEKANHPIEKHIPAMV